MSEPTKQTTTSLAFAPAIFVSRGAKFWGRGRSLERLGRLSIGFHIPLVHSVRNEFKTLCGRAEKPHPTASEQPQTFFFFFFATQFFFFISSYFQKIDKKYQNFSGGPGFETGGIPGRSPIVSDNCKNSPAACPPALRPQSRVGGEGRET